MIDSIRGKLIIKEPARAVIECGGIGFELNIPYSTYQVLPKKGEKCSLFAHLVHRENAMELYGFSSQKERELYRKLIAVSGIGPKIGIAVLSGMDVDSFISAIKAGESGYLTKISGIGKKTAQRLIVELRDRVKDIVLDEKDEPSSLGKADEALDVLLTLGYKKPQAEKAIKRVMKAKKGISVEEIVKLSLKEI
ncbi:MAG: Holliday junction branch migration protein RuvA [Candidatus Zixiibacteriota bacterium]